MDRHSWPWKKKTYGRAATLAESDDTKRTKYVHITIESYAFLSGLEDQVKILNEKLLSTQSEITVKDDLVKQHAKVAEEAVSGWEKAEAEALVLKQQLESVTLLKVSAEERALNLDDALKESMKQMRDIEEESQQKLQDVVNTKTKELEKFKAELETRIIHFEEELQKASVENSELSRSLQERSSLLMKASEEKFQADSQIEMLKNDLYSCEKEISSIKYELNVISKELEIRNKEKNMYMKSAEAANKRHLEDVKRITKLEAECQRLRVLVRKKLPGPAALAQMKLEVESLGREHGEDRLQRSPAKGSSPQHFLNSEFTLESIQQLRKEKEFLSSKLLALEEEMRMLKETLSKRNSELQASRNFCSKQGNKLHQMESHVLALIRQNGPPNPNFELHFGNEINLPCFVSTPKDGIDEEMCSESSAAARISGLSHCNQEKLVHMINKCEKSNHLELMDDFLEMERLACLPTRSNGSINMSGSSKTSQLETAPFPCMNEVDHNQQKSIGSDLSTRSTGQLGLNEKILQLLKLKLRTTSALEANAHGTDMINIFYDIWNIVLDAHKELFKEATYSIDDLAELNSGHTDMQEITGGGILLKQDDCRCTRSNSFPDQQMKAAISHILEFVLSLGKAVAEIQTDSNFSKGLFQRIEEFPIFTHRVISMEITLHDFILALSRILCEANDIGCRMWKTKGNEGHSNGPECIDKETLSEKEVTRHEPPKDGFEAKNIPLTLSLENFEHIKLEKEKLQMDLSSYKEALSQTNFNLIETEKQLTELKSELASCRKSNSLSETQMKCMVESYRKLESLKEELEVQIDRLHARAQSLLNELQVERSNHQDDIAKYSELQEQMERSMKLPICSFPSNADDTKTQQDIDIAAAAEKLAECQETIFLLGKQLQAMRGQAETKDFSKANTIEACDVMERETGAAGSSTCGGIFRPWLPDKIEQTAQPESPVNVLDSQMNSCDAETSVFPKSPINAKNQKQKICRSSSSSSSSNTLPEKHGRGFSRLFSLRKSEL